MPSTLASFTKGKTAWYLRSSNPGSESENYKYLKNLQNNRWSSRRQIPSKEELLQRVSSPTYGAHISLNTWWLWVTLFEEDSLQIPR